MEPELEPVGSLSAAEPDPTVVSFARRLPNREVPAVLSHPPEVIAASSYVLGRHVNLGVGGAGIEDALIVEPG
jgi:hypothetical protein